MAKPKVIKIKWKVQELPTGRYRSFYNRGWPDAVYADGSLCAMIACEDEYYPRNVKTGEHKELTLRVAVYTPDAPRKIVTIKKRFATLKELKEALPRVIAAYPDWVPDHLK